MGTIRRRMSGSNVSAMSVSHQKYRPLVIISSFGALADSTRVDRRSINRRSAQKHRARRKEELDDLNKTISERDARIAQLERDLAVEKSRTNQLAGFIKMQMGRGGAGSGSSLGGGSGADGVDDAQDGGDGRGLGRRSSGRLKGDKGP